MDISCHFLCAVLLLFIWLSNSFLKGIPVFMWDWFWFFCVLYLADLVNISQRLKPKNGLDFMVRVICLHHPASEVSVVKHQKFSKKKLLIFKNDNHIHADAIGLFFPWWTLVICQVGLAVCGWVARRLAVWRWWIVLWSSTSSIISRWLIKIHDVKQCCWWDIFSRDLKNWLGSVFLLLVFLSCSGLKIALFCWLSVGFWAN